MSEMPLHHVDDHRGIFYDSRGVGTTRDHVSDLQMEELLSFRTMG